jgi:hypothetical protein
MVCGWPGADLNLTSGSTAPASDQSDTGATVCSEAAHSTSSTERRCRCVLASFTAAHCVWAAPGGAFTACGRACKAIPMADHQQHSQQFQRPSLGSRSYRICGPCLQSAQGRLCLPTSALMRCKPIRNAPLPAGTLCTSRTIGSAYRVLDQSACTLSRVHGLPR